MFSRAPSWAAPERTPFQVVPIVKLILAQQFLEFLPEQDSFRVAFNYETQLTAMAFDPDKFGPKRLVNIIRGACRCSCVAFRCLNEPAFRRRHSGARPALLACL